MIDWQKAVVLAREGRMTMGEIADAVNWPKWRSLSTLVRFCESKLPARRRIRGIECTGPVTRHRPGAL